jgi:hypothetical protein
MFDLQEQMREGFFNISRQIRASNSPQIEHPRIEGIRHPIPIHKSIERGQHRYVDEDIEDDDQDIEDDDQDIEEMIPEYESDEVQYHDDKEQERDAAQKQYVKDHRKEIKVRFVLIYLINTELLISHFFIQSLL